LDVPIMIGVSVLMLAFGWDGKISSVDGIILFLGAITYTVFLILQGKQEPDPAVQAEYEQFRQSGEKSVKQLLISIGLIGLGVGMLVLGSRWLVDGAVAIARTLGLSELVIGLTIVSAGTSLPELATSIVASMRGERDIAVGNVVGSNIFNILAVLGLSAAVSPNGLAVSQAISTFDAPVMIAVAIACLPVFTVGNLIARWEGVMFVGYYIAYAIYLILQATQHDSLPLFSSVMLWFVIPLTVVTLVTIYWRAIVGQRVQ
jgi:cation:H+ antiporter